MVFIKTMVAHFDFFVDLQASDAWAHMAPEERRRAMDLAGDMRELYDFFFYEGRDEDTTSS